MAPSAEEARREEFQRLVELHNADLMRLAYGMSGDRDIAEDAVQSCWQAAWHARDQLKDESRVRGWLFTIAANKVRRQLNRRRARELLRGRLRPPGLPEELDVRHLDLAKAIGRLSVRDRQILGMRYGLDMTSDDIAPYVGLSPSGTRVRLRRVLQRLREDLGDD